MKKLNLGNISAGLDTLKGLQEQNASVARNEQIKAELIDLAEKTRMRPTTRKKASAILPIRSKNSACSTRLVWSSTTAGTRSFRANAGIKQSHNICTGKRSPAVYLRAYPPGARSSCCI